MVDLEKRGEKRAILRRLNKARKGVFPKTCGASRHTHMIVEGLLDRKGGFGEALAEYEPEHMASSIATVLECLWEARRWMRYQLNDPADVTKGGEWVPDLASIPEAADTIATLRAEVERMREALGNIAEATSAEEDAGENYRWDDREGALDYAYAIARAALGGTDADT